LDTPSKVGISIADIAAGMYAFSGVLAALLRRERTGDGAAIEVSMFDALAEWMGFPAYFTEYGGTAPARSGARHASIAPYGPYAAGDGQIVYLGLQNEREWSRFCDDVLQQPALSSDGRFATNSARVAHKDALDEVITRAFANLTAADVVARLDAAGIANARMNTIAGFLEHPQLVARNRWRDIGSPVGPLHALVPPIGMEGTEPVMGAIPGLGEHTDAILREIGYDAGTINEWRQRGVV
jgi:crotonobetainyl-CoA:carnitine CoA-transferase CaiB-like acyl-CoA transferase